jgi:hypothetical protein
MSEPHDSATAALFERTRAWHEAQARLLLRSPYFAALDGQPRYEEVFRRMNLRRRFRYDEPARCR